MSANIEQIKKKAKAKNKYPRLSEGTHLARVLQVVMLGEQEVDKYESDEKEIKERVMLTFEVPGERITGENEEGEAFDKPKVMSKEYTVSMHEKAGLFAIVKALIPSGTSLGDLVNVPSMIQVGSTSTGNAKLLGVMAAPAGIDVPALENEGVFFDFDNFDEEAFDKLWDWQKEKIKAAQNWVEPEEAEMPEV